MATWSKDEERQLIELRLSPRRNAPEKLHALVQHFMNNGTVWAVTEGDMGPVRLSKDLARKVNGLVRSGKLTWVLNRTDLPSEVRLRTAEKELGPHKSELYYFGVRLRDRLKLPRPDQVVGTSPKFSPDDLGLWGGPGIDESIRDQEVEAVEEKWGFDAYDARSHPVFDDFRRHLAEARCWELLDRVEEIFLAYKSVSGQVYEQIQSEIRVTLPDLALDDVIAMSLSLLSNIYRPPTGGKWIDFDYALVKTLSGWAVQLGSWTVGSEPEGDKLEPIITAHQDLVEQSVRWDISRQLDETRQSVLRSIDDFRASLEPNSSLRRLIIYGQCVNCV